MTNKETVKMSLAVGAAAMTAANAVAEADSAAVDQALTILKTYDWGADRETLNPIDRAIIATHGDTAARKALEKDLLKVLAGGISRSALDYVCRKLRIVGTGQSVSALEPLLADENTSHIARYALERIPGVKATKALRDSLPKVSSKIKPGIISALGVRRDRRSIAAISKLLRDSDVQVAKAAAQSLGLIGTSAAAKRLSRFMMKAPSDMKIAAADACLVCAEKLLADGKKPEALALYNELKGGDLPSHVKAAAMKGVLTATIKK